MGARLGPGVLTVRVVTCPGASHGRCCRAEYWIRPEGGIGKCELEIGVSSKRSEATSCIKITKQAQLSAMMAEGEGEGVRGEWEEDLVKPHANKISTEASITSKLAPQISVTKVKSQARLVVTSYRLLPKPG
ncbi:hypothetical protein ElyMa_005880400 [Elysia marginata]|uniref:Uncharacterized protein n=1 Tax=Elysia marginata TaxID=1093978 RepID=A0AAV4G3M0_9GAST|nr:hypothetical protein ElyMa_005880400 [Elysia marginata]